MNTTIRFLIVAAVSGALAPTLLALSSQVPQNQQQSQPVSTSTPSQGPVTGVSNPPPDDTIQANEDSTPAYTNPAPPPALPAKPSAAIPAQTEAAPVAPANNASAAPAIEPEALTGNPTATTSGSNPYDNTDFGIVTVVPKAEPSSDGPELQKRNTWNPDDHIVSYVPVNPNQMGAGTNITVRLSQELSTNSTREGATFRATVAYDVYNGATLIIPAGSEMLGTVTHVGQGHHLGLHASLYLRPDVIILPDGTAYHLYAAVVQSNAPRTRATDEGNIVATAHVAKDAVEYGAGAGAGAVVGAAVAGPVGAGVGSLVGAGLTTTHLLLQQPDAATLPQGSTLIFSLTQPMPLVPTKN